MKKIWVVVANSSQAKVYRINESQHLVEHGFFYHDESHLPASELVSDRMGHETSHNASGGNSYQPKTSLKLKEALLFADSLSLFLEKGCNAGEYDCLYLVAKPPFLGHLRDSLHSNVTKLVSSEIHKDLTHLKPDELRTYLPPIL